MLLALLFVNSCGVPGGRYCRVDSFLALLRSPTVLLFSWLFKSTFKSGEKWTDAQVNGCGKELQWLCNNG